LQGSGGGKVTSSPKGIGCGDVCSHSFHHKSVIILSTSANTISRFAGWSGACSGDSECQITLDLARSVSAQFDPVPIVTGRVAWFGVPVPGAGVEIRDEVLFDNMPMLVSTKADQNGEFAIPNPPVGTWWIYSTSSSDEYWRWAGRQVVIELDPDTEVSDLSFSKIVALLSPEYAETIDTATPKLPFLGLHVMR